MTTQKIALLALAALLLAGCGLSPATPTPQAYPLSGDPVNPTPGAYPYPYPAAQTTPVPDIFDSSYPAPIAAPPTATVAPFTIPQPDANNGVVVGRLLDMDKQPAINLLYLGYTIPADQPELPPVISFDGEISPKSTQDTDGRFYFSNVPPGTYGLIVWHPVNSLVYTLPNSDQFLVITVEAGQTVDLGDIILPAN